MISTRFALILATPVTLMCLLGFSATSTSLDRSLCSTSAIASNSLSAGSLETIDVIQSRLDLAGMNRTEFIDYNLDEHWLVSTGTDSTTATAQTNGASLWVTDSAGAVQCYVVPANAQVVVSKQLIVLYRETPTLATALAEPDRSLLSVWNCIPTANLRGFQLVGGCWGAPIVTGSCTKTKCDASGTPASCQVKWQYTQAAGGGDGEDTTTCDATKYFENCGTTICWNFGDGV